jgi:hypothetical protein
VCPLGNIGNSVHGNYHGIPRNFVRLCDMEFHEIPRNIGNLARNTEVTEVQKQMEFRGHPKWDTQGPGETES